MELKQEVWKIDKFVEYARNPRVNDHAVDKISAAIREFGFRVPIIAKSDGTVIDGHLRLKAAKKLKLKELPVILADDLNETQIKAFRLSINKMAELADWDNEMLALELEELQADNYDLSLIGFDNDELDKLLGKLIEAEEKEITDNTNFSVVCEFEDELSQQQFYEEMQHREIICKIMN